MICSYENLGAWAHADGIPLSAANALSLTTADEWRNGWLRMKAIEDDTRFRLVDCRALYGTIDQVGAVSGQHQDAANLPRKRGLWAELLGLPG